MDDTISRQAAIRWIKAECNPYGKPTLDYETSCRIMKHLDRMPSAEPERLTDDDFETIRIHLNAQKEKLCNQQRWEEAKEYQRIIDRFMAFASAEPRKKGKWIKIPEFCGDDVSGFVDNHFSCSECKKEAEINSWGFYILSDFCPNCGSDMRGEQE